MSLWLALIVAVGMAFLLIKSRRTYTRLPQLPVVPPAGVPDVTVIIPARNEESVICRAVASFPGLRVVVIDDASQDRTPYLAQAAGAEVYKAPALDPCVRGKPNACRAGAAVATSEWLLFVDADTWYAPNFAHSIVSFAERQSLDLVTAFLRQKMATTAEQLILPYAAALYFSIASKAMLANGQCLLFRRAAYQAMGGHASVARSLVDDVALAALAKTRGLKMKFIRAEHLGAVRLYEDPSAIRRGFEKYSLRFIAANLLPVAYLPVLFYLIADAYYPAAIVFSALPVLLLMAWYPAPLMALSIPAAIYIFEALAVAGLIRSVTGAKTAWKGREI